MSGEFCHRRRSASCISLLMRFCSEVCSEGSVLLRLQCNAKWVLKQSWRSYMSKKASNATFDGGSAAVSGRATYCRGPFFTWAPGIGSHTHVGVHTGLYIDLVVLIKSLEESIKIVQTQLDRIKNYNTSRVTDGRFLFGNGTVDEARGGIFILDVSDAQPHSAAAFIVHQLAQMLEYWCVCRLIITYLKFHELIHITDNTGKTISDMRTHKRLRSWL
jgi:hypothetical protein